jgi:hypothetical protein
MVVYMFEESMWFFDLAAIVALVARQRRKACTVADGLARRTWIRDIRGTLGPVAMVQYFEVWCRLWTSLSPRFLIPCDGGGLTMVSTPPNHAI